MGSEVRGGMVAPNIGWLGENHEHLVQKGIFSIESYEGFTCKYG
jgi:hypothetical protein